MTQTSELYPPKTRVVSLVPSWTETLLRAGHQVVGRTRYCVHPEDLVADIPVIGGTKSVDWTKLTTAPDLVIFDKEENKKEMADHCPFPFWASHIQSIQDLPAALTSISTQLNSKPLLEYSRRWQTVLDRPFPKLQISGTQPNFPGLIRWFHPPTEEIHQVAYFVWRKPWMILQRETFIGSILEKMGLSLVSYPSEKKYPEVELDWLLQQKNIAFLFSSEPYPFEKRAEELKGFTPPCALVDGEAFGWFGIRSLEFLEKILEDNSRP
jgi:hypothetical protein